MQAALISIAWNTSDPLVASALVPTGSKRCSSGSRSSESDGGFRPVACPVNSAPEEGETDLDSAIGFPFLRIVTCFLLYH